MTEQSDVLAEAEQREQQATTVRGRARRVLDEYRTFRRRLGGLNVDGACERLRERLQSRDERQLLQRARAGRNVCWTEADDVLEPLVTVRIATYNRGPLIVERAIASALSQTYPNLEVLVVGDRCDDATSQAVRSVQDSRLRFLNLPRRGLYPQHDTGLWMVGGVHPMNAALSLARGDWIAPCDDDDEFTPTHVESLLAQAKREQLEMVYSRAAFRSARGTWHSLGSFPPRHGTISHGAVLYSAGLAFFRHSETCWKLPEPADWNMWKRMVRAGVRIGFLDEITYLHY